MANIEVTIQTTSGPEVSVIKGGGGGGTGLTAAEAVKVANLPADTTAALALKAAEAEAIKGLALVGSTLEATFADDTDGPSVDLSSITGSALSVEPVATTRAWTADDAGKVLELGSGADLSSLVSLPEGKRAEVINPTAAARSIGLDRDLEPGTAAIIWRTGPTTARYAFVATAVHSLS